MKVERFGHAAIKVRDLLVSEPFYREVLGFSVEQRFPEDNELIFGFGADGHLLVQAVGADTPAPEEKALGVHHLAFIVGDGERGLESACTRLATYGIPHRRVDHGDHRSVYLHDPDGYVLELYHAPGDQLIDAGIAGVERLRRAREFVFGNARLVDRVAYQVMFEGAPADRLVAALDGYRNDDGGYGQALEPDLRCPASQPLHTETALTILKEAGIRRRDIAEDCCRFLARIAQPDGALPAFLEGALDFPAAAHWQAGFGAVPSLDRTLGMVALLEWHGARSTWLGHATERCRQHVEAATIGEAHHLLYAFRFVATCLRGDEQVKMFRRLAAALTDAEYFVEDTPVTRYGLTPLHFAPEPGVPERVVFDEALLDRHLDDLAASQKPDGGWPIRFSPPGEGAAIEWRGRWTVEALRTLRGYGRL